MLDPAAVEPQLIVLETPDAFERGVRRGSTGAAGIQAGWRVYAELFAASGIAAAQVRRHALESLAAVAGWAPELAREIEGTAQGAGLEDWQAAALNARTEILSLARGARPGECSTVIAQGRRPFSMQTWDWHVELAGAWHLQWVSTGSRSFAGLTEYGILGKIGINDAGVGVHLNVLGHRRDAPGAVPVHVAAAQVLHTAASLEEAVELLLGAPVRTSSAISVVTEAGARMVELSPAGAQVVGSQEGYLLHTNHFLADGPAREEKTELYQPDSGQRLKLLLERCRAGFAPAGPADLVPYLCSRPGDGADLCCVPDPRAGLGGRWATLATVGLLPAERSMSVLAGPPTGAAPGRWRRLGAAAPPAPIGA